MNKIARICWNTNNWKFPSGSKGKSDDKKSFEYNYGYGHEEWLFNNDFFISGCQYCHL